MFARQFVITEENIQRYTTYLKGDERASATIEKYSRDVRGFSDFLDGAGVTKEAAIAWKEHLKTTREASSVNSMLAAINGFCDFFGLDIKVKPFKIQRQIFLSTEKELTDEEYERLLDAAMSQGNERLCFVMQTICSTGIRVSELKFITVEAIKKGSVEIHNKGKIRTILLPTDLMQTLSQYAKKHGIKSGALFVTRNGKLLNRSNIWAEMKKLCAGAGVKPDKVFPHNLRRRFAVKFHAVTKSLPMLSDVLGHANINTTRIYLKTSGAEHRKVINSLGLIKYRLVT